MGKIRKEVHYYHHHEHNHRTSLSKGIVILGIFTLLAIESAYSKTLEYKKAKAEKEENKNNN